MQKHPRITWASKLSSCPFNSQLLQQVNNMQVSAKAFSRHLTWANLKNVSNNGIAVYQLPCSCFVWRYPSGARELSALPF